MRQKFFSQVSITTPIPAMAYFKIKPPQGEEVWIRVLILFLLKLERPGDIKSKKYIPITPVEFSGCQESSFVHSLCIQVDRVHRTFRRSMRSKVSSAPRLSGFMSGSTTLVRQRSLCRPRCCFRPPRFWCQLSGWPWPPSVRSVTNPSWGRYST